MVLLFGKRLNICGYVLSVSKERTCKKDSLVNDPSRETYQEGGWSEEIELQNQNNFYIRLFYHVFMLKASQSRNITNTDEQIQF